MGRIVHRIQKYKLALVKFAPKNKLFAKKYAKKDVLRLF
jgi:hypothetical protein